MDKDFIIRGLLTVSDCPISFAVENIERHWGTMETQFETFVSALNSAVDFCKEADVGIRCSSLLIPINTLFPIIYYLNRRPRCSVPDSQRKALRTLLYLLLFNGFVGSDARIRWLREVLIDNPGEDVPLDALIKVIPQRQRHYSTETTVEMLNWYPRLTLNIVQPTSADEALSWQARPEADHIFPQSVYRPQYGALVDDIGNFAFLGKLRNIRKRDQPPWEYFADTSDDELRDLFLITDRNLLADDKFMALSGSPTKKI